MASPFQCTSAHILSISSMAMDSSFLLKIVAGLFDYFSSLEIMWP
jgi:hypothetical protein